MPWMMTTTENERTYRVIFYCGTSIVAPLVDNKLYPEIAADYERAFRTLRTLQADVFVEGHPERFDMLGKLKRRRAGEPNPFVDATELPRFVEAAEREFRAELRRQQTSGE